MYRYCILFKSLKFTEDLLLHQREVVRAVVVLITGHWQRKPIVDYLEEEETALNVVCKCKA